jgi:hypothetical protein
MIFEEDPTRAWTHPDGTTFLPIQRPGCTGCAAGPEGTHPCHELPDCTPPDLSSIQWVHDTPENRALFVIQRMEA